MTTSETVVASPTIGMDDAVWVDSAPNNDLQRGFRAIRNDLGVGLPLTLVDSKHWRFAISSAPSFTFDSFTAEIGFVDFDLAKEGRFPLTKFDNSLP